MMKKSLFAALLLAAASPVLAQSEQTTRNGEETVEYSNDKYKVETNGFWSNWFITAGAGPQVMFSDHDKQMGFGERISPAVDIAVGKWFTPGMGLRLMYSGVSLKGATQNSSYSTGEVYDASQWLDKQKFKYFNLHADVMMNLSNIFCGYNENRIWNCSPYLGFGVMRIMDSPKSVDFAANLGLYNSFRLCSSLDLNLDIRGTIVKDNFENEVGGRKADGILTASVGLTYKFPKRNWERSKTVVRYDNAMLNQVREDLNNMCAENERLKNQLKDNQNTKVEKIKVAASNIITFKIGSSKLTNENRVKLRFLADVIKSADPNAKYMVIGYADAGTGSKGLNLRLSEKRAKVVYDCLVNEFGVKASQLQMDYKGGVENMFYDDPRLSRSVIIVSE